MEKDDDSRQELIPLESINQAQLLLEYAAQSGQAIEKQITADIVNAKHQAAPGKWTTDIETSFWQAYDSLAEKIKPVSVMSLKALRKVNKSRIPLLHKYLRIPKTSDADKIVMSYRLTTVIFILVLIFVQILYSYGAAVVNELNQLPDNITKVDVERQKIISGTKTSEEYEKTKRMEEAEPGTLSATKKAELGALSAKKESLERKYRASFKVLEKWRNMVRFGINPEEPVHKSQKTTDKLEYDATGKIIMLQDAVFILQVLQCYLLPLLYGFVGACAYILRSLSNEIKNVTYISASRVVYLARFLLGGLSGLAIGWFVSPNTSSALKTVSPFAVAFVAGYGVELLFTIMDKIIGTFSTKTA